MPGLILTLILESATNNLVGSGVSPSRSVQFKEGRQKEFHFHWQVPCGAVYLEVWCLAVQYIQVFGALRCSISHRLVPCGAVYPADWCLAVQYMSRRLVSCGAAYVPAFGVLRCSISRCLLLCGAVCTFRVSDVRVPYITFKCPVSLKITRITDAYS